MSLHALLQTPPASASQRLRWADDNVSGLEVDEGVEGRRRGIGGGARTGGREDARAELREGDVVVDGAVLRVEEVRVALLTILAEENRGVVDAHVDAASERKGRRGLVGEDDGGDAGLTDVDLGLRLWKGSQSVSGYY